METLLQHSLTKNFSVFFNKLNPSITFEEIAAREYKSIKSLIESPSGLASNLSPVCFLQGSYKQDTAIHSINDVDVIALCKLWQPGSGTGQSWGRNEIFDTISAPLLNDYRYKNKISYKTSSMCIKIDLGIKIEILPVVYKSDNNNLDSEPFRLWRPEENKWCDGFARYHQQKLTEKNKQTAGNFIPAVKVFKHINKIHFLDSVSFHIESFLYNLRDDFFIGSNAYFISQLLKAIASCSPEDIYNTEGFLTPCKERKIFTSNEWGFDNWKKLHGKLCFLSVLAQKAISTRDMNEAISLWQLILGEEWFPKTVAN